MFPQVRKQTRRGARQPKEPPARQATPLPLCKCPSSAPRSCEFGEGKPEGARCCPVWWRGWHLIDDVPSGAAAPGHLRGRARGHRWCPLGIERTVISHPLGYFPSSGGFRGASPNGTSIPDVGYSSLGCLLAPQAEAARLESWVRMPKSCSLALHLAGPVQRNRVDWVNILVSK